MVYNNKYIDFKKKKREKRKNDLKGVNQMFVNGE